MGNFFDIFKKRSGKLEQKLVALAECGVTFLQPYTIQTLIERQDGDRSGLDQEDLQGLLYSMSMSGVIHGADEDEHPSLCGQVVTFDTERIEGPGSYAPLLAELAGLSGGALRLSEIEDEVDFGQEEAQLRFVCNGQRVCISFNQNDDWFEPLVWDCLGALLSAAGSARRYFWVNTGDQCAMLGCLRPEQIKKLEALGIPVELCEQRLPLGGVKLE